MRPCSPAAALVLAICAAAVPSAAAGELDVLDGAAIARHLREVEAEKRALTPAERKIDHAIRRRPAAVPRGLGLREAEPDPEPRVSVRLRSVAPQDLRDLAGCGFELERLDGASMRAEGRATPAAAYRMAELPCVAAVKPVHRGWLRVGAATTEGDAASRAPLVRAQGDDGSGVVVGVISDGIDHVAQSQATGDLPAVTVPADTRCTRGGGDEGTALLEIVHDLAPGARLLFSSGSDSELTFEDAVRCLAAAGANVIVDDLGFFDQPFFEDGPLAAAVEAAIRAGVSYHSAAGNEAGVHLEQTYRPSPTTAFHDFLGGPVDNSNDVSVAPFATVTCILQWNDPFGASANDYDLLVFDSNLRLIADSGNPQTGTQDPIEEVSIVNPAPATQTFKLAIIKAAGATRVLKLFCFGAVRQQYVTPSGSVVGQPALRDAVAVGAIDVSDAALATVEPYSSQGPARIFFPAPETRPKPDIVAFDGVSISNAGGFPRCPPACRFFGTSAAAPHSAAAAALMLARNPALTPAQIQNLLRATAVDIGAPGPDDSAGAGRLDAFSAAGGCADDRDCTDGNACTTDRCDSGLCRHATVVCDDGEPCTTDACDASRGCVHSAVTGVRAVTCWLDGVNDVLGSASAADIRTSLRQRIDTGIDELTMRIELTAEAARAGDGGRESRMLRAARRSFVRLLAVTTRARTRHGITRALARVVRGRLVRARTELKALRRHGALAG